MSYDYTKHDNADASNDDAAIDNFEIADNSAPGQTAEEIRLDNSYNDMPPGQHTLLIHSFSGAPKFDYYKVMVNGVLMSYEAPAIRVRFCLPHAPKTTIEDYFVLPPTDPGQMTAYINGIPAGKKMAGFNAKKFYQFIGAIGFPYPAGGNLPPEARKLGNWKGRTVQAVAQEGQPYEEKDKSGVPTGNMKAGRPQVKLFSYLPTDATAAAQRPVSTMPSYGNPPAIPGRQAGQGAGHGAGQGAGQRSPQPVAAGAAGLDDL